ncbi:hypothetical protein ACHAXT_001940 [Thalassiosira profunda]
MARTMSGLTKPLHQRGRHVVSRTARASVPAFGVSSYAEDKRRKHRQQTTERMTKWLLLGVLAVAAVFLKGKKSTPSASSGEPQLRISTMSSGQESLVGPEGQHLATNANGKAKPNLPFTKPNPFCVAGAEPKVALAKGADDSICGRKIPINLAQPEKWPTPHYKREDNVPKDSKEVTLLKKEGPYGSWGNQMNEFFHAFDVAYDMKRPLYMTKDSWAMDMLLNVFFGTANGVVKDDAFWGQVQDTLGMTVIEDESALKKMGLSAPEHKGPNPLFYYVTNSFDAEKIRDHRNTILRKLFQYPAKHGGKNACASVDSVLGNKKDKKYSVIHMAPPGHRKWLEQFGKKAGIKDPAAASYLQTQYVKDILQRLDMMQHDIYPIHIDPTDLDKDIHSFLAEDKELKGRLKDVDYKLSGCLGGNIYLAVLADVYLGNPVDQLSLWVARMRFALGIDNTFIFTKDIATGTRDFHWVSYMSMSNYTALYDKERLGPPWMG